MNSSGILSGIQSGLLASLLAFSLPCGAAQMAANAPAEIKPEQKAQLALNWKPEPQFGGFYAAQASGAYAKRGLNIEILPGGAGAPVVQMVAAGKSAFGVVSADEALISRARGSDVVALFAAFQINPQCLMARAERKIKNLAELFASDGPIAMQKGLPYALFLLQKYPQRRAQIVPYFGGIAQFVADKNYAQQGFATSEPLAARKQGCEAKTFLVADEGFNPYTTVLIARQSTVTDQPTLAREMVAATREGWTRYLADPGPANKLMRGLNPSMSEETFIASAAAQKPLIEPTSGQKIGQMSKERWDQLARQLLALKLIDVAPDAAASFRDL